MLLSFRAGIVRGMPALDSRTPGRGALDLFIRNLADRQFAVTTRRIRRHYLEEYLHHAQQATGATEITLGELLDPARRRMASAMNSGRTRTRNTLRDAMPPRTPASTAYPPTTPSSMAWSSCGNELLLRDYLTRADIRCLLRDLAAGYLAYANAVPPARAPPLWRRWSPRWCRS